MFKNYKHSLFNDEVIIRSQQRFRSDHHRVYTEEVNKIALSSNGDKRIQKSDRITTYSNGMEIDVDSQNLREESENTRKESAQIIARSQSPKSKSVNVSTQTIFIDEIIKLHSIHQTFLLNDDDIDNDTDKEVNSDVDKINNDIDKDADKEINNDVDKTNDGNTKDVIDDTITTKKEINDDTEKVSNDANITNKEIIDDNTEKIIDDNTNETDEEIDDDTEEKVYIKMLNKMISKVNEFKLAQFTYASCFDEVNKILIEIKEGNTWDDEIYEDPWLKLNELYGITKLFDKFFDKIWKLPSDKNRKVDKNININKYLKIDKYTDKYTDITNGKLDPFNNIGSILAKATSEIQNEAYIVNDLKQNENADINMLKIMDSTLQKALIK